MAIKELSTERSTSHRSLQVINEVKCVIRELVENAIDAGASNIIVKLIDNGASAIQVIDNGRGIRECNFEQLAMPNTTSKIQKFEDIFTSLSSHGFRGEALNSIANVGTLEVETRVANEEMGWLLKFASDGRLTERAQVVTKVGTSVTCRNLFEPYPVRRGMMLRNARNSASGSVSMVQQYALIHPDIRFALTNTSSSNNQVRNLFSSTGTCTSIRGAAQEVFGHSFAKNVVDVDIESEGWKLEGVISSPQTGRQSNDIQVLFINSRPVDDVKNIKKCLKDVHRQFSSKNNVAFVLNLVIDYQNVDINLAPDKRRLFLLQEEVIIQQLKERIVEYYLKLMAKVSLSSDTKQLQQLQFSGPYTNAQNKHKPSRELEGGKRSTGSHDATDPDDVEGRSTQLEGESDANDLGMFLQATQEEYQEELLKQPENVDQLIASYMADSQLTEEGLDTGQKSYEKQRRKEDHPFLGATFSGDKFSYEASGHCSINEALDEQLEMKQIMSLDLDSIIRNLGHDEVVGTKKRCDHPEEALDGPQTDRTEALQVRETLEGLTQVHTQQVKPGSGTGSLPELAGLGYMTSDHHANQARSVSLANTARPEEFSVHSKCVKTQLAVDKGVTSHESSCKGLFDDFIYSDKNEIEVQQNVAETARVANADVERGPTTEQYQEEHIAYNGDEMCNDDVLTIDMNRLYNDKLCTRINEEPSKGKYYSNNVPMITDSGMMDPSVFLKMKVCGQFNNGFIVAKLEGTEIHTEEVKYSLYLIDPHAADEKTKFELYNDVIKIVKQPLVVHKRVDLSPFHQQVVEANLDLLKENGFEVYMAHRSEETGEAKADTLEPGVYLSSYPQLLGHILGEEDFISFVHDLANHGTAGKMELSNTEAYKVLWGGKDIVPRPNRVWNILATRACKKAVKLGEPLSMKQMETIKNGLANLVHPWNCPHGRPTMKCLITTEQLTNIIK